MVARCGKRETGVLSITFSRDGDPPKTTLVADGRRAMQVAVRLILEAGKLRPGDCLIVSRQP